jgi:hypothetical protein
MHTNRTNTKSDINVIFPFFKNILIFLMIIGALAIIYKILEKCYNRYILRNNYYHNDYYDSDDDD